MPQKIKIHLPFLCLAALYLLVGCWFVLKGAAMVDGNFAYTLFDDAMISMNYARNLAHGHGLVWYPGETPVEGFTNPHWTIALAALHLFPLPENGVGLGVALLGLGLLLRTLFNVYKLSDHSLVAPLFTAASYALNYWTLRGMEVGLLACLITEIIRTTQKTAGSSRRRDFTLAVLLAVAVWVRMDSVIWLFPLSLYFFIALKGRERNQALLFSIGGAFGALFLLTAFRLTYFGEWLPNTYYLKLSGVAVSARWARGVTNLISTLGRTAWPLAIFVLLSVVPLRRKPLTLVLPFSFVLIQTAYSIHVGGDAWDWYGFLNRYMSVAVPCAALCAAAVCSYVVEMVKTESPNPRQVKFAYYSLMLLSAGIAGTMERANWRRLFWERPFPGLLEWQAVKMGLTFAKEAPAQTRVAVFSAGTFCYFSRLHCLDALGKVDKHIARQPASGPFYPGHDKHDYPYTFLQLKPAVVIGSLSGSDYAFLDSVTEQTRLERMNPGDTIWLSRDFTWPTAIKISYYESLKTPPDLGLQFVTKLAHFRK